MYDSYGVTTLDQLPGHLASNKSRSTNKQNSHGSCRNSSACIPSPVVRDRTKSPIAATITLRIRRIRESATPATGDSSRILNTIEYVPSKHTSEVVKNYAAAE